MGQLCVLSLGAGVQSTVVLLLSCRGELPKLDAAIFADTGWESREVYANVAWLTGVAKEAGIPLLQVTAGNIREDALRLQVRGKSEGGDRWASMPLFTLSPDGGRGMIRRQCTKEYKIQPIHRKIRELLGVGKGKRVPSDVLVEQWFGISGDEQRRMRQSRDRWIKNCYPLVWDCSPSMTRVTCVDWLRRYYPGHIVRRSSCLGCPFHSQSEWREIKRNSFEWEDVVAVDTGIRRCGGMLGDMFLHASRKPLAEASLDEEQGRLWSEECTGYCGD